MKLNKIYDYYKEEQDIDENENSKLSEINVIEYSNSKYKKSSKNKCFKFCLVIFITIFIFFIFFLISFKLVSIINNNKENNINNDNNINAEEIDKNKKINLLNDNQIINDSKKLENNIVVNKTNNIIDNPNNNATKTTDNNPNKINKKIGLAFLYVTLYSNGIARFITTTANNLMKTGKYDICFITSKPYSKEYKYNSNIKRFIALDNYTLIRNITKHENIDIFILQNVISPWSADFYRSLGKKAISIFHGVFMSAMTMNHFLTYRKWNNFDSFDSYVFIASDDYYFYKNLGFKNEIFIPNLIPFEPSDTQSSNLTYNNIMMLGRLNDQIKGVTYAVKAMTFIIKEVPDAKLYLVTSDSRVQYLRDLIKELNLTNNVFIHGHTYNISSYFWNCSVHLYTSLSEAYPMAMNEGKAHGLPIVAFDVPYSNPYQDGVIVVDQLDCEALARETIMLLKNYHYRKKMGDLAKQSLYKFSNQEIVELWGKLFNSLLSNDANDYRKLQD